MILKRNRKLLTKLSLLLFVVLIVSLLLSGCSSRGMSPVGWSGVAISDGVAYTGSREGRLVAVNLKDSTRYFADPLKVPVSGSACSSTSSLGCASVTPAVAIYGTPALVDDVPIGLDSSGKTITGKIAIIAGYNGSVIAYQSNALANLVWQYNVPEKKNYSIVSPIVVHKGLAYFGCNDGKLYALSVVGDLASRTTKMVWNFTTGGYIWAAPAVSDDVLVVGSFDKKIYGLNALTGDKIWEFTTGANILAPPFIQDGIVYAGSLDSTLYALNLKDGKVLWSYKAENWFWSGVVVSNGLVFAPSLDKKVYALNARTGSKVAEYDLGGQISATPVIVNGKVIVATQNSTLWAIDPVNSSAAARKIADIPSNVSSHLAADGDIVYINAVDSKKQTENKLYGFNVANDAILSPVSLNY